MDHMTNSNKYQASPHSDLNDHVDAIHVQLWDDESYRAYLSGLDRATSVEGSLDIDDIYAAKMVRAYARENGVPYVAMQNLSKLVKALRVVKRRYSISRKVGEKK